MASAEMTPVGFEPTQLALVELESTPLDHSGKVSLGTGSARNLAHDVQHGAVASLAHLPICGAGWPGCATCPRDPHDYSWHLVQAANIDGGGPLGTWGYPTVLQRGPLTQGPQSK